MQLLVLKKTKNIVCHSNIPQSLLKYGQKSVRIETSNLFVTQLDLRHLKSGFDGIPFYIFFFFVLDNKTFVYENLFALNFVTFQTILNE